MGVITPWVVKTWKIPLIIFDMEFCHCFVEVMFFAYYCRKMTRYININTNGHFITRISFSREPDINIIIVVIIIIESCRQNGTEHSRRRKCDWTQLLTTSVSLLFNCTNRLLQCFALHYSKFCSCFSKSVTFHYVGSRTAASLTVLTCRRGEWQQGKPLAYYLEMSLNVQHSLSTTVQLPANVADR